MRPYNTCCERRSADARKREDDAIVVLEQEHQLLMDTLGQLADGWTHVILSNHVPELPEIVCQLGRRCIARSCRAVSCLGARAAL